MSLQPGDPQRILVVATQRLGDVLLATPLMRSLRRAWPRAHIAALVFADTAAVLAANADLDAVLTVARRPGAREHLRLLRSLWRHYDLAFSTGSGDRPTLYACIAGRRRVGMVGAERKHWWKRRLLTAWQPFDDLGTHTVVMNLRLADLAGVDRAYEVVAGWSGEDAAHVRRAIPEPRYAVLHVHPMFVYKAWHAAGWAALGRWIDERGLRIVLTGSAAAEELAEIERLLPALPAGTRNVAGQLSLAQSACLLSAAELYVGPDTVITHAAAALGTPTVALFGPSNPVKWGPWPKGCRADPSPYRLRGSQRVGNVFLVQGEGDCVPCMQEGCDRHIRSLSACLQQLPAARVIAAAQAVMEEPASYADRRV